MANFIWTWSKVMVITNEIHASQGLGNNGTFLIPILSTYCMPTVWTRSGIANIANVVFAEPTYV